MMGIFLGLLALVTAAHLMSIGSPFVHARPDLGYWIVYRIGFLGLHDVVSVHHSEEEAYRKVPLHLTGDATMIVQCDRCLKFFDDEFRTTSCPHSTFAANDGNNNFTHNHDAYLDVAPPPTCAPSDVERSVVYDVRAEDQQQRHLDDLLMFTMADRFKARHKDSYASSTEFLNLIFDVDSGAILRETRLVTVQFSDGSTYALSQDGSPVVSELKVSQVAGVGS